MTGVVERYLEALTSHDWGGLSACLADDFVRVGPYGDVYPSMVEYVAFISDLMPRLADYEMEITRITYADGRAFAELTETVTMDGAVVRTPECITFDFDANGHIARIEVFIQTLPPHPSRD